ncbi:MAG TPA: signal peptidase II, partial [Spartobacteria bacterium]|nr:signal peptidase II [Spartobacteria bacterium]
MKFIFVLSLPLYALDQLTKSCVLRFIKPDEHSTVIAGFFDLVNITNTGAAFGSFKNNNTFFVVISCLALLALLFVILLLVRRRSRDAWRDISLALLLAGVL